VRQGQPTASKPQGRQLIQARAISACFISMQAAFPMWKIEPDEANIKLWNEHLAKYTVRDLRRTYVNIINAGGKSPPTLGDVKVSCRGRDSDAIKRQEHTALPPPPPVTDHQAKKNIARLKRILAGVELDPGKDCHTGHLSKPMQRRFREIVAGYPTFNGDAIDPSYIPNERSRERYMAEIEIWREENPNV